jgi:hypothetical protein
MRSRQSRRHRPDDESTEHCRLKSCQSITLTIATNTVAARPRSRRRGEGSTRQRCEACLVLLLVAASDFVGILHLRVD